MSAPIRLVVVDDHALFRRGLVGILNDIAEFTVVGEASNGREALPVIQNLKPDVVLMDVNMPEMDGIEAVEQVRSTSLPVRILMLTISEHEEDLLAAIRLGADGYILKNTDPEELRKAILHVSQGEGALSPEVTGAVLKALARQGELASALLVHRIGNCLFECGEHGTNALALDTTVLGQMRDEPGLAQRFGDRLRRRLLAGGRLLGCSHGYRFSVG